MTRREILFLGLFGTLILWLMVPKPVVDEHYERSSFNTVVGPGAGVNLKDGSWNIILGDNAGKDIKDESLFLVIGSFRWKMKPYQAKQLRGALLPIIRGQRIEKPPLPVPHCNGNIFSNFNACSLATHPISFHRSIPAKDYSALISFLKVRHPDSTFLLVPRDVQVNRDLMERIPFSYLDYAIYRVIRMKFLRRNEEVRIRMSA